LQDHGRTSVQRHHSPMQHQGIFPDAASRHVGGGTCTLGASTLQVRSQSAAHRPLAPARSSKHCRSRPSRGRQSARNLAASTSVRAPTLYSLLARLRRLGQTPSQSQAQQTCSEENQLPPPSAVLWPFVQNINVQVRCRYIKVSKGRTVTICATPKKVTKMSKRGGPELVRREPQISPARAPNRQQPRRSARR
jgi:hypothetical protein